MNIETIKSVYFVGAGGIGMSALVRYFLFKGKVVAGYDLSLIHILLLTVHCLSLSSSNFASLFKICAVGSAAV